MFPLNHTNKLGIEDKYFYFEIIFYNIMGVYFYMENMEMEKIKIRNNIFIFFTFLYIIIR